ncbi:MAG: F0F1 ATP synthase subunit B [Rhodobacteraceae bacterium]|nr:F0F1 ATP synthase subunit B [Paracoccaceae bacterium]
MRHQALFTAGLVALATPAFAAEGAFFSLGNTDFVVIIAFVLFVGVLLYLGVPKMLGKLLDKRAEGIRTEIDEARTLQEEAKSILATYERKRKEMAEHSKAIVAQAKAEAEAVAAQAKADLKETIARRLVAAEDQIKSAEVAAVREVKDKAVNVAIAAASDVIASNMAAKDANSLIDAAIKDVGAKLH